MRGREVVRLGLDLLDADPSQPRRNVDSAAITTLAESLATGGQHQPILVRRHPDQTGRFLIVDGHRRTEAARQRGLSTVEAIVVPNPEGPGELLLMQLGISLHTEPLGAMDEARAIKAAIDQSGSSAARVAALLGLSQASISRKLSLLALAPTLQEKVECGALPESAAAQIARAGDSAEQERLAAEVLEGRLTRDGLAGQLKRRKQARGDPGLTSRAVARAAAYLGGGRTVTLVGAGLDSVERLIEWLEELLAKARKVRPRGVELATFLALLKDEAKAAGGGA